MCKYKLTGCFHITNDISIIPVAFLLTQFMTKLKVAQSLYWSIADWLKKGNAPPGLDGMEKKHIAKMAIKEALKLYFNLILTGRTQPSYWN